MNNLVCYIFFFFFQAEDGIRDLVRSRGLGDVYKRQAYTRLNAKKVFVNQIQAGDLILGLGSAGQTSYESTYNSGISCNGPVSYTHLTLPTSDLV